ELTGRRREHEQLLGVEEVCVAPERRVGGEDERRLRRRRDGAVGAVVGVVSDGGGAPPFASGGVAVDGAVCRVGGHVPMMAGPVQSGPWTFAPSVRRSAPRCGAGTRGARSPPTSGSRFGPRCATTCCCSSGATNARPTPS